MNETVVVPLNMPLDMHPEYVLDHIEWWDETSRFVVVKYSIDGNMQEFGLRIDLDKRVFLDQLDDPELNSILRSKAVEICNLVGQDRSARMAHRGLHAAE